MITRLIIIGCIIVALALILWYCQRRWRILYDPRIKAHQLWVPNEKEKVLILDPSIPNNSYLKEFPQPLPPDWFVLYEPDEKYKYRFYFVHRAQWIPKTYLRRILAPNLKLIIVRRDGVVPEVHSLDSELVGRIINNEEHGYYMFGIVMFEGWGDKVSEE